jgi:hypothetical protein
VSRTLRRRLAVEPHAQALRIQRIIASQQIFELIWIKSAAVCGEAWPENVALALYQPGVARGARIAQSAGHVGEGRYQLVHVGRQSGDFGTCSLPCATSATPGVVRHAGEVGEVDLGRAQCHEAVD